MLLWQMKITLIIKFSCSEMPYNAEFCKVLSTFHGIVVFFSFTTFFAKKCKMKQITSVCSSQIVVSLGGADYYDFLKQFNDYSAGVQNKFEHLTRLVWICRMSLLFCCLWEQVHSRFLV